MKFVFSYLVTLTLFLSCLQIAFAQAPTFAGNPQHTSVYSTPATNLNTIKWTKNIDLNNTSAFTHYGSPLITPANTVLAPIKIAGNGFRVDAFNGTNGQLKYSVPTDYILPNFSWIPTYNPTVVGNRMYFAGAGGTIF